MKLIKLLSVLGFVFTIAVASMTPIQAQISCEDLDISDCEKEPQE